METKQQHGGKRPNAGKPKGVKHPKTLERQAMIRETQQRVYKSIDNLLNAQFANALGSLMVFRLDTTEDPKGNTKTVHTLLTDPAQIKEVLDGTEGNGGRVGEDFYIITTVQPDNRAIDSLLDRGLGKPAQSVELQTNNTYFERDVYRTAMVINIRGWSENEEYITRAVAAMVKEHGYLIEEFKPRVVEAIEEYGEMEKRNEAVKDRQLTEGA